METETVAKVRIGKLQKPYPCTLVGDGICKYCGAEIVWATLPNGKYIPLDPEAVGPGEMKCHLRNCAPRPAPSLRGGGIAMTEATWRQLLRLIHPDKHHATADERLANDLTAWLIAQRPGLRK